MHVLGGISCKMSVIDFVYNIVNLETEIKMIGNCTSVTITNVVTNVKNGHITLTTPLLGLVCHCRLGFDSLPACKI